MKLLWLDLETTGLDPATCRILEVAACVADLEDPFNTRDPYEAAVRLSDIDHAIGDIGSERWCNARGVHDVVREMHARNGLWAEVARSGTTIAEAEDRLIAMTGKTPASDRENQTTLAGSCASFDLAFIRVHMPRLAKFLHYRVFDVPSVILFARSMGMPRPPKVEAHRAMADVRESIENARRCADYFRRDTMTCVYRYGLLAPTTSDELVRAQLRAAHDYRNDLVAIERGRRSALRAVESDEQVAEAEAIVKAATRSTRRAARVKLQAARRDARTAAPDELARIAALDEAIRKDARALTPCYWGTYLGIEESHRQARQAKLREPDALTPNDPRFVRGPRWREAFEDDDPRATWWLAEGQIGVQLQGGLSVADALAGQDRRLRIEIDAERAHGRRFGHLWLRIGSDGRDPVWAVWPIKMHRAMPDAGIIKWARVSLRTEAMREVWSCELTVETPSVAAAAAHGTGAIAVEWEWTPLDDGGIRVARWADTRGGDGDVVLPSRIAEGIRKPNGIRAVRDMLTNAVKDPLAKAIRSAGDTAPRWAREAAATMHLWRSPMRFIALAMRWRREGLPDPRAAYEILDAWEARERHLWEYEASARGEALRERREFFRVLAAEWRRRYATVLLSDQDLSREARWGDDGDVRFIAAVSELRMTVEQKFGTDAVRARWRDGADEDDERAWCERCRDAWQAGGARGDGMFAERKEKTANAWSARREKRKNAGSEQATARKATCNAAE